MICIRTNLKTGYVSEFDILQNPEFIKTYGYRNFRNVQLYALEMIEKWNKQQPDNWRYHIK